MFIFSALFFIVFFSLSYDSLISRENNVNLKETRGGSMVTLAVAPAHAPIFNFLPYQVNAGLGNRKRPQSIQVPA